MSDVVDQVEAIDTETILEDVNPTDAGAMSFDELESIVSERSEDNLEKEPKEEIEAKENESQDEAASESEEKEASEEAVEEEVKKLIAKYGEEELEIAANSLFKHKVDGEEVDVELQELLNNYSGKISYDRKFQEFSSDKKDFDEYKTKYDKDIQQINNYINNFAEKFKGNDALGALEYFAEFTGMKPYEFRRELISQIEPEVQRRSQMTEEQILSEELSFQNEYLAKQHEAAQQQIQEQQAYSELLQEIADVQKAHGIPDDVFEKSYLELAESDYEGEITPVAVADYHNNLQAYSRAEEVLTQVDPSLAEQDPVIDNLQKVIMENPSFDNNDLLEMVQQVYDDYLKNMSKSVSKKASPPKKQETNPSQSKQDFMDWEDV